MEDVTSWGSSHHQLKQYNVNAWTNEQLLRGAKYFWDGGTYARVHYVPERNGWCIFPVVVIVFGVAPEKKIKLGVHGHVSCIWEG